MKVVAAVVGVCLNLAEVGEQVGVGPLAVAEGGPGVVVLGHAAQEDLAVDGAGPAGNLAPGHHHGWRLVGGPAGELPVVVAGHHVGFGGVAELHLFGQVLEVGVVGPRLQQQDRLGGVLSQAGSQDCPGGTGPDNHIVILHQPTSTFTNGLAQATSRVA